MRVEGYMLGVVSFESEAEEERLAEVLYGPQVSTGRPAVRLWMNKAMLLLRFVGRRCWSR